MQGGRLSNDVVRKGRARINNEALQWRDAGSILHAEAECTCRRSDVAAAILACRDDGLAMVLRFGLWYVTSPILDVGKICRQDRV